MSETTLTGLFGNVVAAAPDAVALVTGVERLTFAELDAASNRLARALVGLGAGPGDLVVLALPRAEMVAAILATAKAGAAFVPVDPDHASERLGLVLDDARPVAAVTTAAVLDSIPALRSVTCLVVDDTGDPATGSRQRTPRRCLTPTGCVLSGRTTPSTSSTPRARRVRRRVWSSQTARWPTC